DLRDKDNKLGGPAAASLVPSGHFCLLPLWVLPRRSAHAVRVALLRGPFFIFPEPSQRHTVIFLTTRSSPSPVVSMVANSHLHLSNSASCRSRLLATLGDMRKLRRSSASAATRAVFGFFPSASTFSLIFCRRSSNGPS